jgi:hypothetical protein
VLEKNGVFLGRFERIAEVMFVFLFYGVILTFYVVPGIGLFVHLIKRGMNMIL